MNKKKDIIIEQIKVLAESQNFEWINDYNKPKDDLLFKYKSTGVIIKTNWSNLKQRGKIPLRNCIEHHNNKLKLLCDKYDFTLLSSYKSYAKKVKYICNKCATIYERLPSNIYKCGKCNNFYKNNKGINIVNVLKTPNVNYKLYFVYIPAYNAYKIGLYKGKYVKSRFNTFVEILNITNLPLYKAYYLEQYIINKYKTYKYIGLQFGGYTEAFNNNINKEDVIKIMGASILDVEPRELLENLEADNQQPSFIEI